MLFFSLFKIDNKKVVVINFWGKGYGDMGKYICNELLGKGYNIYWACKEDFKESIQSGINYVKYDSILYLYHLATAKVWINNTRFWYGIRKRKSQFYIQTWHGCIVFKKVESAIEDKLGIQYVLSAKRDSKMANLFISNSTFGTNFYKKYFWYSGDILEYGCPRNDIIVKNCKDSIKKVKDYFSCSNSEKICLYAPTFREKDSLNTYNIDYNVLLNALKIKFKGNWKIFIRLHPNISYLCSCLSGVNKNIIDATNYPDMQELLVAADFMITDYSSSIFDYALSKKPAMIYASDVEEYKKSRDFEIKLENTPFPLAMNNEELKQIINNFDIREYKSKLNNFYTDIGIKETGKSTKMIVEIINKITKDKQ